MAGVTGRGEEGEKPRMFFPVEPISKWKRYV